MHITISIAFERIKWSDKSVPNHVVCYFSVKVWFNYSNKLYLQITQIFMIVSAVGLYSPALESIRNQEIFICPKDITKPNTQYRKHTIYYIQVDKKKRSGKNIMYGLKIICEYFIKTGLTDFNNHEEIPSNLQLVFE